MTTSITLEVRSDDEPLASEIQRVVALGEHSIEFMSVLVALHQFEAARLSRAIGHREEYDRIYAARTKR